jgi:hypothetical protein
MGLKQNLMKYQKVLVRKNAKKIVRSNNETPGTLLWKIVNTIEDTKAAERKGAKGKLAVLLNAIVADEGKRVPDYRAAAGLTASIERYIFKLRKAGLIEFQGVSNSSGGYFITEKMKGYLK